MRSRISAILYICYNSLISIDHRPFFYKSWFDAGVKQAKDLMDTNGTFFTYNAFLSKYRIKTNFLSYHGVLTVLRRYKETFSPHINKTMKGDYGAKTLFFFNAL